MQAFDELHSTQNATETSPPYYQELKRVPAGAHRADTQSAMRGLPLCDLC